MNPPPPPGGAPTFAGQPLQYPVRQAGQPYQPGPSEPIDQQAGQTYRNGLVSQQQALPTVKRNLQEVIDTASQIGKGSVLASWVPGSAVVRNLNAMVKTPQYVQLSKDLANTQISMIKASGGSMDTDAGKALTAAANGTETYPPEVLLNIAQRTAADVTNTDMQATAAQRFQQQYGDNNMNAFKLAWNKNADTKVFQAMNLYEQMQRQGLPVDQIARQMNDPKNGVFTHLFGTDPATRQQYKQKYLNIQSLYQTGNLQ
jgi:hypothetical protein